MRSRPLETNFYFRRTLSAISEYLERHEQDEEQSFYSFIAMAKFPRKLKFITFPVSFFSIRALITIKASTFFNEKNYFSNEDSDPSGPFVSDRISFWLVISRTYCSCNLIAVSEILIFFARMCFNTIPSFAFRRLFGRTFRWGFSSGSFFLSLLVTSATFSSPC